MKKRRFLLVMLAYIGFASLSWAQTENAEPNTVRARWVDAKQKKINDLWILDSLYVGEIGVNKTETAVDYNAIHGMDEVVFTKLDLRSTKGYLLERKQLEVPFDLYERIGDGWWIFECEEVLYVYRYQLTDYLTLEREFSGGSPDGMMEQYRIFMRYKKTIR
jgi:hypothetical protein